MFRTGMVEAWGRGIERIVEGSRRIDAPDPIFSLVGRDMSVEFIAPQDAVLHQATGGDETVNEPVNETVNETVNEPVNEPVLSVLRNNPKAPYEDISTATGYSRTKVMRQLQKMKQAGEIERVGSDKKGYWRILR